MHGRASQRLRALAVLGLGAMTLTAAALAVPVEVLRTTDGLSECVGALAEGQGFRYEYVQSIYLAPVIEELERHGDRIRILRASSTDIRAIEYFRWDGPIRHDPSGYVQDAPFYETDRLVIRISPPYHQRIDGAGWTCDLPERFGDRIVAVEPAIRPALALR